MYKIILALFLLTSLNAKMVDGVAVIVKGEAITLFDIKQEMKNSKVSAKRASDILIRRTLEAQEVKKKKISVSTSEVYENIKETAKRNNLSIDEFYKAIRDSSGLSSAQLKEKVKQQLLSKKLYSSIAFSSLSEPTTDEIQEYYKLHQDRFSHPSGFNVVEYRSKNSAKLQEKIDNPMFFSPQITSREIKLPYEKISPQLAGLLKDTPIHTFSKIIPNANNEFISFYIKGVEKTKVKDLKTVRMQVINMILEEKRELVLNDYFIRLRQNADIKNIRLPKE